MIDSNVLIQSLLNGLFIAIKATWWLWLGLTLLVCGKIVYRSIHKRQLAKSGINEIDKMDGKTFEKYMEVLFDRLGYKVERTRYVGDYGADLVTVKDGIKTVVQVKRYKGKVNIKAIQEAVAAKGYYACDQAMVATNSDFTQAAVKLAEANSVLLWDRERLAEAMLKSKQQEAIPPAERSHIVEPESLPELDQVRNCAVCGKTVSDKVYAYCVQHQARFDGKILCFDHQRS